MSGYIVLIVTSVIILFLVWYRGRSTMRDEHLRNTPDRSLTGEAATAFEDIALDIICPNDKRGSGRGPADRDR